jgi:hypothetical protein
MHGNVELSRIIGNYTEGIGVAGIDIAIENNTVIGASVAASEAGILIYQEISANYYKIRGNSVKVSGAGGFGAWVAPAVAGLNIGLLDISNNELEVPERGLLLQPRSAAATGCSITKASLRSNAFKSSAGLAFAVSNSGAATYSIGTLLTAINEFDSSAYDAYAIVAGNTVTENRSSNDRFRANKLNGYTAQFAGTNVRLESPYFEGSTGGAGNSRSVRYINTGTVKCTNPQFANLTYKAELETGGPTEYLENGATGSTTTVLNTGGARLVTFYGAGGLAIAYGTAAPTTGTWSRGDRVFNSTPTVGQPKSWACTVAGTPGTWVSEGNL